MVKKIRYVLYAALLALTAAVRPGFSQLNPSDGKWAAVKGLTPGTEIMVRTHDKGTLRGRIASVTDDSLVVNRGRSRESVSQNSIARLSIRKKSHRGRNTLIGIGVGGGVGLAIGAVWDNPGDCHSVAPCTLGHGKQIGPPLCGMLGAAVGAVLPTGGWRHIYWR